MISSDLKYVIKRIIIGVAIALIVLLIRKNVYAKEISSVYNPFSSSNMATISNVDSTAVFDISGSPWSNWGIGTLHFNFSIIKVSGSATDPIVVPHQVSANNYICDISSNSVNNSTWTGNTYSANCNMNIGSTGLTRIVMDLSPNQQNNNSLYRITISPLLTYETYDGPTSMSSTNSAINDTTSAINNQTQAINNQTNAINNQTSQINSNISSSTTQIIQNQNQNTNKELEAMQVCSVYDKLSIYTDNKYLYSNGELRDSTAFGVSNYISITNNSEINALNNTNGTSGSFYCYYDSSKTLISCVNNASITLNTNITIPSNAYYIRFSFYKTNNNPRWKICKNGNQALVEQQQQNTQNIINNQNINNEKQMQSQMICNSKDYSNSAQLKHSRLDSSGNVVDNDNYGVSRYISLSEGAKIVVQESFTGTASFNCFYSSSRTLISCSNLASEQTGDILSIPTGASYVRFSFRKNGNSYNVCSAGNQVLSDTLTDSDIDSANADFDGYIHNAELNHHGLTDLITAPLRLLNSFLTSSCTSLTIPLPFVEQDVVLPCMSSIYTTYFNDFLLLYRLITDGIIAYWVAVGTFRKIQGLLDPTDTRVEVFNL